MLLDAGSPSDAATAALTDADAGYANHYGYTADVSATLTFRIVPVPPPQGADELRVVPDLTASTAPTVAAARAALAPLGLVPRFVASDGATVEPADDDEVTAQTPTAGVIVGLGDEVTLTVDATP